MQTEFNEERQFHALVASDESKFVIQARKAEMEHRIQCVEVRKNQSFAVAESQKRIFAAKERLMEVLKSNVNEYKAFVLSQDKMYHDFKISKAHQRLAKVLEFELLKASHANGVIKAQEKLKVCKEENEIQQIKKAAALSLKMKGIDSKLRRRKIQDYD